MELKEFPIEEDGEKFECIDLTEEESDSSKKASKPGSSNVIDYIFKRQQGRSKNQPSLSSIQNARFTPKRFFNTTHNELHISSCECIKPGLDGESVVGLWKGDEYRGSIIYKFQIKINSSRDVEAPAKTIASVERSGPAFATPSIIDMCDIHLGDQNGMLYVGKYSENWRGGNSFACTFPYTSPSSSKQYFHKEQELTCCSGCRRSNLFALGTTRGIIIYQDGIQSYVDNEYGSEGISAMELSPHGNIVYCGCHTGSFLVYDWRSDECHKVQMSGLGSMGISTLKLLSNEHDLIACSNDGILAKIDIRMAGLTTIYAHHVEPYGRKTPLNVSENADLVCATGSDNITRVWSFTTGELLHIINPWNAGQKTHSVLFSSGLRWGIAMFQQQKMYVIEPWD